MDAAVLWDRLPEVTQNPFLGPGSLSKQSQHWESLTTPPRIDILCRCCHNTHSRLFMGFSGGRRGGSAAVCDPKPSASICSVQIENRGFYWCWILPGGTFFRTKLARKDPRKNPPRKWIFKIHEVMLKGRLPPDIFWAYYLGYTLK